MATVIAAQVMSDSTCHTARQHCLANAPIKDTDRHCLGANKNAFVHAIRRMRCVALLHRHAEQRYVQLTFQYENGTVQGVHMLEFRALGDSSVQQGNTDCRVQTDGQTDSAPYFQFNVCTSASCNH